MPGAALIRTACAVLAAGCLTVACTSGAAPARTKTATSRATPTPTATAPTPTLTQTRSTAPVTHAAHSSPPKRSPASATALPLRLPTDGADQVITVTAPSTGSTTATLQAWQHGAGGWQRVGPSVHAFLGTDGLSTHPSETRTATPIGSFTLTQAFGELPDPGTALPYTHTTPDDWWISQAGPLYNTRQRCAARCPFTQGAPNEHLYYELPYYRYAVVIDYNTRNAPGGVHLGAGSAFFLHVTVYEPTQGCVSIPQDQLVRLLRWLEPSAHPRILIGVA